jgi:hypothetical protein
MRASSCYSSSPSGDFCTKETMWVRQTFDGAAIAEVAVDDMESLDLSRSAGFSAADALGPGAVDVGAKTTF